MINSNNYKLNIHVQKRGIEENVKFLERSQQLQLDPSTICKIIGQNLVVQTYQIYSLFKTEKAKQTRIDWCQH